MELSSVNLAQLSDEEILHLRFPESFPPMHWVNHSELINKLGGILEQGEIEPLVILKLSDLTEYKGISLIKNQLYIQAYLVHPIHPASLCEILKPEWTKEQALQWLNEHFPEPHIPFTEMQGEGSGFSQESEVQQISPVDQATGEKKPVVPKRKIREEKKISDLPICEKGYTGVPLPILELMLKKALTDTERLYLAICRMTLGWSQDGMYFKLQPLRELTGMGTSAMSRALKKLKERGWVVAKRGEGIFLELPPSTTSLASTDDDSCIDG